MSVALQRVDAAVRGVLAAVIRDYRAGRIDRDTVLDLARHRAGAIQDVLRAEAPRQGVTCRHCTLAIPAGASAMVGGHSYCQSCAPLFRLARPA